MVGDIPITRYWLIPSDERPKMFTPHPTMSADEIRDRTQRVWDRFYTWRAIWVRSACTPTLRARIAFIFLSKLYRQMYAGTGISTDSARRRKSQKWARWTARQCKRLFRPRQCRICRSRNGNCPVRKRPCRGPHSPAGIHRQQIRSRCCQATDGVLTPGCRATDNTHERGATRIGRSKGHAPSCALNSME